MTPPTAISCHSTLPIDHAICRPGYARGERMAVSGTSVDYWPDNHDRARFDDELHRHRRGRHEWSMENRLQSASLTPDRRICSRNAFVTAAIYMSSGVIAGAVVLWLLCCHCRAPMTATANIFVVKFVYVDRASKKLVKNDVLRNILHCQPLCKILKAVFN